MKLIGLDVGTTGICGVRLDSATGEVEIARTVNENMWLPATRPFEKIQDPKKILAVIDRLLGELMTPQVGAIGVTGQMHGIVYLNAAGEAVSPLYTWQDERGNEPFDGGESYAERLHSHAGYGNVTHFYNQQNGLVPPDAVVFCTIHDYVAMKLAGRTAPLIHASDAASFGDFEIAENRFAHPHPYLPPVTDRTTTLGRYGDIPVAVAIGDNQAGFIGTGCTADTVLFNVGTGSQISFLWESGAEPPAGIEIRPLTEGKCIAVGCSLCGGRAFALLEKFFRSVADMAGAPDGKLYDAMERIVADKEDTDLRFCTLFCGTRDEPTRRAAITALSEQNFTPADMVLACLSGITDELYDFYAGCGKQAARLVGSGNAVRKTARLRTIAEKRFGTIMQIPLYPEEAACGAALFARAAVTGEDLLKITGKAVRYHVV